VATLAQGVQQDRDGTISLAGALPFPVPRDGAGPPAAGPPPPPPGAPRELATLLAAALSPDPAPRPRSGRAWLDALLSVQRDLAASTAGGPRRRWAVAVQATLGFDVDAHAGIMAAHAVLADQAERLIGVVITPDRKASAAVTSAQADGADARHKSWLRVRDWVQERPERGGSMGIDLALLREAEYFLTPRVAELYRLEELMPGLPAALRPALAAVFFDLNDVSPAPLIATGTAGMSEARIAFPRTGDPAAEILIEGGTLALRLADGDVGAGFVANGAASTLAIDNPLDWVRGRSAALAAARRLLPVAR